MNGVAGYGAGRDHPLADYRSPSGSPGVFLNLTAPPGYYDGGVLPGSRRQVEFQMAQRHADAGEQRDSLAHASNPRVAWPHAYVSSTDARADHDLAPLRLQEVLGYQCQLGTGRLS